MREKIKKRICDNCPKAHYYICDLDETDFCTDGMDMRNEILALFREYVEGVTVENPYPYHAYTNWEQNRIGFNQGSQDTKEAIIRRLRVKPENTSEEDIGVERWIEGYEAGREAEKAERDDAGYVKLPSVEGIRVQLRESRKHWEDNKMIGDENDFIAVWLYLWLKEERDEV